MYHENLRAVSKISVSNASHIFPCLKCLTENTQPHFFLWCTMKRQLQQSPVEAGEIPSGYTKNKAFLLKGCTSLELFQTQWDWALGNLFCFALFENSI